MDEEPPHCLTGRGGIEQELERTGRDDDRAVATGQVQRIHPLAIQPWLQPESGGFRSAELEHVVRDIYPVDVDPLPQVVEQQPAGPTRDVKDRLSESPDRFDVERALRTKSGTAGVGPGHPHRVPAEPALPDFRDQLTGRGVEGQLYRAVVVGRVARRHRPLIDQSVVARSAHAGRLRKSSQNRSNEPSYWSRSSRAHSPNSDW